MHKSGLAIAALAVLVPAIRAQAQTSAQSALAIVIPPEARVQPRQVALAFQISADGASDVVIQTASVAAWVRTLPTQAIGVTMRLLSLDGPGGQISAATLGWTSVAQSATGGGRQASCTAGAFAASSSQDLAAGWQKSGTLECAVSWQLADPGSLPPGSYTGLVEFTVAAK